MSRAGRGQPQPSPQEAEKELCGDGAARRLAWGRISPISALTPVLNARGPPPPAGAEQRGGPGLRGNAGMLPAGSFTAGKREPRGTPAEHTHTREQEGLEELWAAKDCLV